METHFFFSKRGIKMINNIFFYAENKTRELIESDKEKINSVAFQGSLGRNFHDNLSDIDLLLVFNKHEDSKGVIKGEYELSNVKWSIYHLSLDRVNPKLWEDKVRYVYGYETLILFDKNQALESLCLEARLNKEEQQDKVVYKIKKLGNLGVTYQGIYNQNWRGMYWADRHDTWIHRNDYYSAHMRLNQAHELLLELIYYLNGVPVPSKKWKHHNVKKLEWCPTNNDVLLDEIGIIKNFSLEEFNRRHLLLVRYLNESIDFALENGLLPENIYEFYTKTHSSHSDNTH